MSERAAPLIGFKRHVSAATVPGEAVYVTSTRGTYALSGQAIEQLAPLLDGSHTLAEVCEAMSPALSAEAVGQVLGKLAAANLVGYRHPGSGEDASAEAYWDLAGVDQEERARSRQAVVYVETLGEVDAGQVAEACRAAGLTTGHEWQAGRFTLVLCDDYLDPALEDVNARHLAAGRPWLLAKPAGADVWVGPLFRPGAGPCWACLASRLRAQRPGHACVSKLAEAGAAIRPPDTSLPATRAIGAQLAVLETAKWLAGCDTGLTEAVWTLDTLTLESAHHKLTRRPQCPACGDPDLVAKRGWQPIVVGSRPKSVLDGNSHRAVGAEEVWEQYHHLVDPITGITDKIVRDPRCPPFLHSYLSGPNRALGADRLSMIRAGLRQQSGGKGRTAFEAKVGALCEAVERYCGSRFGDEPTVRDTFACLGAPAVHPDECQLFHPRQYRERDRWNAAQMPFQHIPEPFRDDEVIDWTPVWSLTWDRRRLVPTDLLYYRGDAPHPAMRANSNGGAAGGSLEDAILQGFLELVERDAVALWWYNRTRQPAVDLDSFDDPWLADLREHYRRANREFWVIDLTADLDIPVMGAISRRTDKPEEDIMFGFGAHFDPRVALWRAVTELGQLMPAVAQVRADGTGYGLSNPHFRRWWRESTVANQPYLLPDRELAPRTAADYGYRPRTDLLEDLDHIRDLTRRLGLEVLVVDQTRPDIGMPVVKVVVPGLRHIWARFAPGRLYDVPVRLGRLPEATPYERLNPTPLFF
ncbi:TOMM precursor leader peptide-binding protein [Thermoactinospora rubra]|uniref:TOMM precursor leader peptide-binding protein n=1 Tax=Thermoactinospora rubra TaxID=1088767 RepID=UPI00198164B7|nr:TOMM precursor leader peptide-binding protein [Thermoactinospora rubra]